MKFVLRLSLLTAFALLPLATPASAQYMYLDSNANGVHDDGDRLNPNGTATTVDVWLFTNQNRDGTIVECNVDPSLPLNMNSYVVNLKASGGEVTYANFVNGFPLFTTAFGEANAGAGQYKNGFGGPASAAVGPGGPFKICTITITGTTGSPLILINDINTDSQDFTSFGTRCDGNDFDSTYKLSGPGGGSDWTDADGLDAAPGGNAPPELVVPPSVIGNENSLVTITANATDADAADLITIGQTNNTAFLNFSHTPSVSPASATLSGTPSFTQSGVYTINWSASDPTNPAVTATTTLTINNVDRPVTLSAINDLLVPEGESQSVPVSATDPDGDQITLTASLPPFATLNPPTTGNGSVTTSVSANPGFDDSGTYPSSVTATTSGAVDTENFDIIVQDVAQNQPPVLGAIGNKAVDEGSLLAFTATATDPDVGDTLGFSLDSGAPAGATINGASGAFSWTPTEQQGPGVFPITVRVTDQSLEDSETIQVTVNEVNVAPVLAPIGNKVVQVGAELTFTATATDADVPANTLTFSLGATFPAGATINGSTGAFSWTPTAGQVGTHVDTVKVTDNGAPALGDFESISIEVQSVVTNQAPVLDAIGNKTVNEESLLSFTATATDPDAGDILTFSLDAGSPTGVTINGSTGEFSWTPTEAQGPGVYPITVRVTDDGTPVLDDSETIQVTVNEVNQAPVLNAIGNQTAQVGVELSFIAAATDADVPANVLSFSLDAGAPAGATINSSTGAFSWTPTAGQTGPNPVTVRVTDDGTPALSDFETITIDVSDVVTNLPPVLDPIGDKTVDELALLTFTATATDPDAGDVLTFSLDAGAPAGAAINGSTGEFSWTPTEAQGPGVYPITVRVTDDGTPLLSDFETIQVTVNELNVAPVLDAIGNKTVEEGSPLTFTATATDADLPANVLSFSLDAGAPAGATINSSTGAFTWTPTEAQGPGDYPVTVRVSDGDLDDAEEVQIQVNEMNEAPVLAAIGNKSASVGVELTFTATATDVDVPANTLTFSLDAGAPAGATINSTTGAFSWTPTAGQTGNNAVTVRVTDDGVPLLDDFETIQINVGGVNSAPVLTQPTDMTVDEGATADQGLTATDADGDALTFSKESGPAFMTVTTIGPSTGNIHLEPGSADAGIYPASVGVTDGIAPPDVKSFQITVNDVNGMPTADADGPYSGSIGVPVSFDGTASSDPDGDALDFAWDFGDGNSATGPTPSHPYAAAGVFQVLLTVTDPGLLSDSDQTTATIRDFFEARAFFHGGNRTTRLSAGKPTTCVQIEPVNESYMNSQVDLASIVMIYQGNQIFALSDKTVTDGDKDGNGIQEIAACFSKADLRTLFEGLPKGENEVQITIEGDLIGDGHFVAETTHRVFVSGRPLGASVSPNPLNPATVLGFTTTRSGHVRVQVFDLAGRLVRTLHEGTMPEGFHSVRWDGSMANGNRVSSGVYYFRIAASEGEAVLRATVLK